MEHVIKPVLPDRVSSSRQVLLRIFGFRIKRSEKTRTNNKIEIFACTYCVETEYLGVEVISKPIFKNMFTTSITQQALSSQFSELVFN